MKDMDYAREYGSGFVKHLDDVPEDELTDLEEYLARPNE